MVIKNQVVKSRFDLIDDAIKRVEAYQGDTQIASYLSSFLAVMISGIYEDCIEHLFCERAAKVNDAELYQYVKKTIAQLFRNPKFANLLDITQRFSDKWTRNLKNKIPYGSKVALDSIVDNKNAVSHGGTSNLTISDIKDYHSRCRRIFVTLEKMLI